MISNSLDFSSDIYNHVYQQLEDYIYRSDPFNALWLFHLKNLQLEVDSISLDQGIFLRQTTHDEKVEAINSLVHRHYPFPSVPRSYLEIHHTIDRTTKPNQQDAAVIAQAVVLALRLIKGNYLAIEYCLWDVPNQPFRLIGVENFRTLHPLIAYNSEPYIFAEEEAKFFPKLLRKLEKVHDDKALSTAITRFEDSYQRTKLADKLIDYWTALEGLFFLEDEFQDMGKSLALAASYYLGQTTSERRTIYNDLTRSHTLRSYYIHGERKRTKYPLDEMVLKTSSHLRNALRKRVEE